MEKHNYHNLRQRVAKLEHDLKRELQQQIESLQNKIDNAKKTRYAQGGVPVGDGPTVYMSALPNQTYIDGQISGGKTMLEVMQRYNPIGISKTKVEMGKYRYIEQDANAAERTSGMTYTTDQPSNISKVRDIDFLKIEQETDLMSHENLYTIKDGVRLPVKFLTAYIHNETPTTTTREISFQIETKEAGETLYITGYNRDGQMEEVEARSSIYAEGAVDDNKLRARFKDHIGRPGAQYAGSGNYYYSTQSKKGPMGIAINLQKGNNVISVISTNTYTPKKNDPDWGLVDDIGNDDYGRGKLVKLRLRLASKDGPYRSQVLKNLKLKRFIPELDIGEKGKEWFEAICHSRDGETAGIPRYYTFITASDTTQLTIQTGGFDNLHPDADTQVRIWDGPSASNSYHVSRPKNELVKENDDGGDGAYSYILWDNMAQSKPLKANTRYWLEVLTWTTRNDPTPDGGYKKFKMRVYDSGIKGPGIYNAAENNLAHGKTVAFKALTGLDKISLTDKTDARKQEVHDAIKSLKNVSVQRLAPGNFLK